jgi:tRNA guanosine-2'-O-methyltransferase
VEKLLDEGTKSPRTIRLAALHLTGLWLLYPETTKYYIRELKLLSLYGSGISTFLDFSSGLL